MGVEFESTFIFCFHIITNYLINFLLLYIMLGNTKASGEGAHKGHDLVPENALINGNQTNISL